MSTARILNNRLGDLAHEVKEIKKELIREGIAGLRQKKRQGGFGWL